MILIQLLLIIIVGLQIFIIYALDRVTRELQVAAAIAVDELVVETEDSARGKGVGRAGPSAPAGSGHAGADEPIRTDKPFLSQ